MLLRPGNAGANTAADHVMVIDRSLAQIPTNSLERITILVRADTAGATHATADHCQRCDLRFSFGYELTDTVRTAILQAPEDAWIAALDQHGSVRENGQVVELTDRIDLSTWPRGSRVIVRREPPHPGAQLSFTDHNGYRFQAIPTDQTDPDIAVLERRHRQRARVEDRIRDDKDTGLAKLPFKQFALNEVWLEIVMLAHDLIVWTQALCLNGELATAEPKRLRYRLFQVAARLAFSGRRGKLHPPPPGHRPTRSSPRSRNSERSPPRAAEPQPPAITFEQTGSTSGRDHRRPDPLHNTARVPAETPPRPITRPIHSASSPALTKPRRADNAHATTARSGLGGQQEFRHRPRDACSRPDRRRA